MALFRDYKKFWSILMIKKGEVLILLFLIIALPICIADEPPLGIPLPEKPIKNTAITTIFFYAGDNLVASKGIDGIQYYHQDRLGTSRITTDQNANKVGETKTLPFGEEIQNTNDARFTFTGKELDSELYYIGARYYHPDLGRFTSVDPIKENHAYSYVSNNPLVYIDPDGKTQKTAEKSTIGVYSWDQGTGSDPTSWTLYGQLFDSFSGLWSRPELLPSHIMVNGIRVDIITSGVPTPYEGRRGTASVNLMDDQFFKLSVGAKDTNPSTLEPRESPHSEPSEAYPYDPSFKSNQDEAYSDKTTLQLWEKAVAEAGGGAGGLNERQLKVQNPVSSTQLCIFDAKFGEGKKVGVYSVMGKNEKRLGEQMPRFENGNAYLDITGLSSGVYLLRTVDQNTVYLAKFTVIR